MRPAPSIARPVALVGSTPAALGALRPAAEILARFGVTSVACSAAEAKKGCPRAVIVASGDGALPAALAAGIDAPVIRTPIAEVAEAPTLDLLTGQNAWPPGAAPFATVAIGEAGARNAALLVISILALGDERLRAQWDAFRAEQTAAVLGQPPLRV